MAIDNDGAIKLQKLEAKLEKIKAKAEYWIYPSEESEEVDDFTKEVCKMFGKEILAILKKE